MQTPTGSSTLGPMAITAIKELQKLKQNQSINIGAHIEVDKRDIFAQKQN